MNILRRLSLPALPLLALLTLACSESPTGTPNANLPPETNLALMPDSDLRTTPSRQHINWWGDDPDGFVAGFQFSFDAVTWTFTTRSDSVFALTLSGSDSTYTFHVRAIDDQGNGVRDEAGPYGAEPYTDRNGNGSYDAGEPFIDFGLADPTPATLRYPIENSRPVVAFVKGSDVPETTFTVASFAWVGTDLDGDETIREYRYALNDTAASAWKSLPRSQTFLTLTEADGIRPGNNSFHLKAIDIAGAESESIAMPQGSRTWFVKRPHTDVLIVDDYATADDAAAFYGSIVDTMFGGRFAGADVLDIRAGATSTKKGVFVPPFINPTLVETFKLFKYILWYCDYTPSIDIAQLSLPQFQQGGGTVLYIASFPESALDPRGGITDYAPVDSLSPNPITFVPANTVVDVDAESPGYPLLTRDTRGQPVAFVRGLFKRVNAANLCRLAPDPRWGNPVVGVRSGDRRFVMFSIPLHRFNGNGNAGAMVSTIFRNDFGVR